MKTWKSKAKVGGSIIEVQVQANSASDAKKLLEAQYGQGCTGNNPVNEVR
jgi:hypothetical protein